MLRRSILADIATRQAAAAAAAAAASQPVAYCGSPEPERCPPSPPRPSEPVSLPERCPPSSLVLGLGKSGDRSVDQPIRAIQPCSMALCRGHEPCIH